MRRSTSLFKLEKHQIIDRAIAFKKSIDKIDFAKYDKYYLIAMDETAVFPGNADTTTVDPVGSSSVYLKSTGYEGASITCILAIRLDGSKARPFIVTKKSLIAGYLYESATFEETYNVKNAEYGHEIMKRINGENSDFEIETGTDMIDVLEDDEFVIDDD